MMIADVTSTEEATTILYPNGTLSNMDTLLSEYGNYYSD